jgi:L-lactate dehydrogenase complex protein LldG
MTARDDVLARIRTARAGASVPPIPRDYHQAGRLAPGSAEAVDLLEDRLLDYKASVHRCSAEDVAGVIAELTAAERVVVPTGLPDGWARAATVDDGMSAPNLDAFDAVVTTAAGACAETGTIVLDTSAGQGRRALSLVPDHHVCIVRASQVVHSVPELVAALDPTHPLTFVSGPSATSDVELQRVEGVHGPRRLDVVLLP